MTMAEMTEKAIRVLVATNYRVEVKPRPKKQFKPRIKQKPPKVMNEERFQAKWAFGLAVKLRHVLFTGAAPRFILVDPVCKIRVNVGKEPYPGTVTNPDWNPLLSSAATQILVMAYRHCYEKNPRDSVEVVRVKGNERWTITATCTK